MEPAVRKLVLEKIGIRRQRRQLDRKEAAIDIALNIIGFDPKRQALRNGNMAQVEIESKYEEQQPFKGISLAESCLQIFDDLPYSDLDKNEVEYYLTIGGYPFNTDDPTNSTEITLRKLASEEKCEVERGKGSTPSRYRSLKGVRRAVENPRTTKT